MNYHIVTFGCQMNVADSEWIARSLQDMGGVETNVREADVILVNTCSVREKPEHKLRTALGRIAQETGGRKNVLVVVTGCVAQQLKETIFSYSPQVRLVAGTDTVAAIPANIAWLLEHPERHMCTAGFEKDMAERPAPRTGHTGPTALVNIMQGCDNFCTYCIVPFTRGRQKSRASKAILDECKALLDQGVREITLLGQNVNAYGKDKTGDGTSFAALLHMVAELDPDLRLRYVTPHPKDMGPEDVAAFADIPNLCPRLHLPMQAGADRVLKRMNRRYDSAGYLALVESLKRARPDIALSTDIIVGFPGETEEEFLATMDMVKRCNFMSSFSFCYSDRPGTRASTFLDKIPQDIQLDRLQRLQALQEDLSQAWLNNRQGCETTVLVEDTSPRQNEAEEGTSWQGRDPYGALVHVALKDPNPVGKYVRVRITHAFKHSLQGMPV